MSAKKKVWHQVSSLVIQLAITVIALTVAAMVFFVGIKKAYRFGYDVFDTSAVAEYPGTDKLFVVEKGTNRAQCMDNLEKSGLIQDKNVAWIQSYFFDCEIYPGTYTLNTSMSTKEILTLLSVEPDEPIKLESRTVEEKIQETEAGTKEIIEGDE